LKYKFKFVSLIDELRPPPPSENHKNIPKLPSQLLLERFENCKRPFARLMSAHVIGLVRSAWFLYAGVIPSEDDKRRTSDMDSYTEISQLLPLNFSSEYVSFSEELRSVISLQDDENKWSKAGKGRTFREGFPFPENKIEQPLNVQEAAKFRFNLKLRDKLPVRTYLDRTYREFLFSRLKWKFLDVDSLVAEVAAYAAKIQKHEKERYKKRCEAITELRDKSALLGISPPQWVPLIQTELEDGGFYGTSVHDMPDMEINDRTIIQTNAVNALYCFDQMIENFVNQDDDAWIVYLTRATNSLSNAKDDAIHLYHRRTQIEASKASKKDSNADKAFVEKYYRDNKHREINKEQIADELTAGSPPMVRSKRSTVRGYLQGL
jgi:hypothetical protein